MRRDFCALPVTGKSSIFWCVLHLLLFVYSGLVVFPVLLISLNLFHAFIILANE